MRQPRGRQRSGIDVRGLGRWTLWLSLLAETSLASADEVADETVVEDAGVADARTESSTDADAVVESSTDVARTDGSSSDADDTALPEAPESATSTAPSTAGVELGSPLSTPPPGEFPPPRYPSEAAARPLTLAGGMLRFDTAASVRLGNATANGALGLTWGIVDELELSASWSFFADPVLLATWRFVREGPVELGLRAAVSTPFVNGNVYIRAGVPLVVHLERLLRLQTGVDVEMIQGPASTVAVTIPAQLTGQLNRHDFLGLQGALTIESRGQLRSELSAFVGVTGRNARQQVVMETRFVVGALLTTAQGLMPFTNGTVSIFLDAS